MPLQKRYILLLLGLLLATAPAWAQARRNATASGFTWGADIGGSIDMTCNSQSSVDLDITLGYRNPFIRLVGLYAATNIMTNDGNRTFPLAAALRTSFTSRPTLCFWDAKIGCALNYLPDDVSQTGLYLSTGVGFNLAMSSKFQSHIILDYTYIGRKNVIVEGGPEREYPSLSKVSLTFGVNF